MFGQVHREGQQRKNLGFRPRKSLGVAKEPIHLAVRHVPGRVEGVIPPGYAIHVKNMDIRKRNVQYLGLAKNQLIPVYT